MQCFLINAFPGETGNESACVHIEHHKYRQVSFTGHIPQVTKSSGNAPLNSKLQHPPRAYPGHLTVHRVRGGGNLNVALEGWGI